MYIFLFWSSLRNEACLKPLWDQFLDHSSLIGSVSSNKVQKIGWMRSTPYWTPRWKFLTLLALIIYMVTFSSYDWISLTWLHTPHYMLLASMWRFQCTCNARIFNHFNQSIGTLELIVKFVLCLWTCIKGRFN